MTLALSLLTTSMTTTLFVHSVQKEADENTIESAFTETKNKIDELKK